MLKLGTQDAFVRGMKSGGRTNFAPWNEIAVNLFHIDGFLCQYSGNFW